MRKKLYRYSIAGLFTLVGIGAGHSTVRASDLEPTELDRTRTGSDATPACSKATNETSEADGATASAEPNPYYCICCDATGNGSCCAKC